MDWISLSLISAFFLGCYDIAKKQSLSGNAVPIVLLCNVSVAAFVWMLPILLAQFPLMGQTLALPDPWLESTRLLLEISGGDHLLLFAKSTLVGCSWIAAFYAIKHLPLSIATPIRSTSPIWTILLAVLLMREQPNPLQWVGLTITLVAFLIFSRVGAKEGIRFHRDPWIILILIATALGALSSLYDKYLLQVVKLSPAVVQAWFSVYLVPVMIPLALHWYFLERKSTPFEWRWSIPAIAIFLTIADYAYFCAITDQEALISVISPIRRSSIIIPFLFGVIGLNEANWRAKSVCVAGLLIGIFLLSYSTP